MYLECLSFIKAVVDDEQDNDKTRVRLNGMKSTMVSKSMKMEVQEERCICKHI